MPWDGATVLRSRLRDVPYDASVEELYGRLFKGPLADAMPDVANAFGAGDNSLTYPSIDGAKVVKAMAVGPLSRGDYHKNSRYGFIVMDALRDAEYPHEDEVDENVERWRRELCDVGVHHEDLHRENLLVSDGRLWVIDYGIVSRFTGRSREVLDSCYRSDMDFDDPAVGYVEPGGQPFDAVLEEAIAQQWAAAAGIAPQVHAVIDLLIERDGPPAPPPAKRRRTGRRPRR